MAGRFVHNSQVTRRIAELVEQERPQLIVPEIEAIATDTLAEIEADGLADPRYRDRGRYVFARRQPCALKLLRPRTLHFRHPGP